MPLLRSLVVLAALSGPPVAEYIPPVDAPVRETFQAPTTPYGRGNRGIDYATHPGDAVRAAAAGEVVFAGQVGVGRHVVVLHPDGIRTTYAYLQSVAVRRSARVAAGDVVGTAGVSLHFGARIGDDYIDPMTLLRAASRSRPRPRLVDDDGGSGGGVAAERAAIVDLLRTAPPRLAGPTRGAGAGAAEVGIRPDDRLVASRTRATRR